MVKLGTYVNKAYREVTMVIFVDGNLETGREVFAQVYRNIIFH